MIWLSSAALHRDRVRRGGNDGELTGGERLVQRPVWLSTMTSSSPTRTSVGAVIRARSSGVIVGSCRTWRCLSRRRRSGHRRRANVPRRACIIPMIGIRGRRSARAVKVEVGSDQDQRTHEIGAAQRDEQGDDAAVAPADEVGRTADDLLEHADRLARHVVVVERRVRVAGATMAAAIERNHPISCQRGNLRSCRATRRCSRGRHAARSTVSAPSPCWPRTSTHVG